MLKNKMSDFGKAVKNALMDQGKTQTQLCEEVAEITGKYFDGSYLYRIMVGKNKNETMIAAIKEILNI